jgi:DNA replication ATP-dependent helicase Dna2
MKHTELAKLFYKEISKNHTLEGTSDQEKIQKLYQLLHTIFFNVTEHEKIQFTTFFSRVAFAFQKYQVPSKRQFFIQEFRKLAQKHDNQTDTHILYQLGIKAVTDVIKIFYEEEPSTDIIKLLPPSNFYNIKPIEIKGKKALMRVVAMKDLPERECLEAVDEETSETVFVRYNLTERNENFRATIAVIRHYFTFPLTLHLLDVEVDTEGVLRPRAFVVEPDHLLDVTAIAECFRKEGAEPLLHLLKKFTPYEPTTSIMKGNIANYFLDELTANPDITFKETFPKTFRINPLVFCTYNDKEIREIFEETKGHFMHLKRVITEGLPKEGILRENCYLEPSFYAAKYGLQGRLDLFYQEPNTNKSAIVELKSGKPFKPNVYGISNNHFTQTLLYDLLIDAAFEGKLDPTCYILYSVLEKDNLKFAPSVKTQQYEALNVRNQILALEQALIKLNKSKVKENNIFNRLITNLLKVATGFEKRDVDLFDKTYNALDETEKSYFEAFSSFIAREHQLAKVGVEGVENLNGVASLWLNSLSEKEENYNIFSFLKIKENTSYSEDALIVFEKTEKTNPLANFRVGDIVVLYPTKSIEISGSNNKNAENTEGSVLRNQIFKCTLVDIQKETLTVRLRSRQLNQQIFQSSEFWHVEHDLLDSGFVGMYKGLFEFARAPKAKRDLLLTINPPAKVGSIDDAENAIRNTQYEPTHFAEMTEEQNRIFNKIITSKDYFLLWGPPGTGKTSVMLKYLVGHFLNNTDENILLLAYTNRAVDEICEAIESLGEHVKNDYVRIGSRYSTAPRYHEQLLDFKISTVSNRKELTGIIQKHRVYVATVASMSGKQELLSLKKFNRVIIDEASQILEPLLVGLLTRFDHFTLIGDHKQLPAVVTQPKDESATSDENLHKIGLHNCRNSFFERLYKRCNTEGWSWAFDVLSHQGRMHQDIMSFPSSFFYERKLQILPVGMNDFQMQEIDFQLDTHSDFLTKTILQKRVFFLNTEKDTGNGLNKTNRHEAQLIGELVKTFTKIYADNDRKMHPLSIGVITPYRAQIAQIQSILQAENLATDSITIDTVERYQGGARDIILLSLCTNDVSQLSSLVSLSEEGVDRKLNVALTRARKHLVVVGNAEILRGSEIYRWFVDAYQVGN